MTEQELFDTLIKKGIIDAIVAKNILRDAQFREIAAEEILYEKNVADAVKIAQIKSELLGIPYFKIEPLAIKKEIFKFIPKETSQNYRIIPISKDDEMLTVGMLYPEDTRAQEALRFIAKREHVNLGVYIVSFPDLEAVWRLYTPFRSEIEEAVREIGKLSPSDTEKTISLEEGLATSKEAPIIKIVASILRRAVEIKASDVHIEPQRAALKIRFRIDGALEEAAVLPGALIQPVASRVKVLANLKLDETRIPQDGRFRTMIGGKDVDFRVATFPTSMGEKVVIRVLDSTTGLKGFEKLGLSEYNFKILESAIERPYGMILATGPTGSGKTTTLYAVLQKLNTEDVNIVSLEDPVEYLMEGVNQSQVRPEIGYNFASGLRQILRQDPDIILVGEIRDAETANLAVNAALTGHIVLSTLHTNNSIGVIPRLIDLGAQAFLLTSALNLMIAQRLVGRLCSACKFQAQASKEAENIILNNINTLPEKLRSDVESRFKPPYNIFHIEPKPDCKFCKGKGLNGRVALFEIFKMTRELSNIINKSFIDSMLLDEARRQGIVSLRQDGIIKTLEGEVLLEEVLKETTE